MTDFNFDSLNITEDNLVINIMVKSFIDQEVAKLYPGYAENIVDVTDRGDNTILVKIISPVYLRRMFWTDYILLLHKYLTVYTDLRFTTEIENNIYANTDMLYLDSHITKLDDIYDAMVSGHIEAAGLEEPELGIIYADAAYFQTTEPDRMIKFIELVEKFPKISEGTMYAILAGAELSEAQQYEDMNMNPILVDDEVKANLTKAYIVYKAKLDKATEKTA